MRKTGIGIICGVLGFGLFLVALATNGLKVAPMGMLGVALMTASGVALATPRESVSDELAA